MTGKSRSSARPVRFEASLQFYIYRLYDLTGDTLYIGKGSGDRLRNQMKRYGLLGETIKWFGSEAAAYAAEKRLIKKHKPSLNRCSGGGGGTTGPRAVPEFGTPEALQYVAQSLAKMLRHDSYKFFYKFIVAKWVDHYGVDAVANAVAPYKIYQRLSY
jgi:hypothetical protein